MEDDMSNDTEVVEYIDSQDEDDPDGGERRPIMLLLRRLIRNKQNTVMTNAQIIDILQSEFNISIQESHELEVDIYIKIIKKYLKDWPQWEELERISTKLSIIKDFEAVKKVLDHKYKNLKEYLGVMLEAAKPFAKEAVKNVAPEEEKLEENIDRSDVVMEIQCTRDQLLHLFFRRPNLKLNNTVFNITKVTPSRISLKNLTFEEIIKGCWVKLSIHLPHLVFIREVVYKLRHVLVNRVRNEGFTDTSTVPTDLQLQVKLNKSMKHTKVPLSNPFNDILEVCAAGNYDFYPMLQSIINIFLSELSETSNLVYVPCCYRKYANKYKYVRYLCADNKQNDDPRYDLQLEETVAPVYNYFFSKMGKMNQPLPQISDWMTVECMFCRMVFPGTISNLIGAVESHFNELHQNESDWQCSHCKRLFSIDYLANNKWYHEC